MQTAVSCSYCMLNGMYKYRCLHLADITVAPIVGPKFFLGSTVLVFITLVVVASRNICGV